MEKLLSGVGARQLDPARRLPSGRGGVTITVD